MAETLQESLVRAIVHLNFDESDEALEVLLVALFELNHEQVKEGSYGIRPAAA